MPNETRESETEPRPKREQAETDASTDAHDVGDAGLHAGHAKRSTPNGLESAIEATFISARQEFSKADRDLVFAAATLKAGRLTERELAKAVADWTVHGDRLLADHLAAKGLISEAQRNQLETDAESMLQSSSEELVSLNDTSGSASSSATIRRLDATGRIARILGLGAISDWGDDGQERVVPARYQLLRKLGQGGLGCVWLARDENLRRFVAVKEISPTAREFPQALSRFRREAEVTGRLEHPSIVPVYQFGDSADARQFYVMRYLGKETLDDAIAEYHERREAGEHDPMQLHRLLTSFVAVCQAIAYAHSRDVVHRDLKPENVALDSYGQVIVLDWGLAKLIGEAELEEQFTGDAAADVATAEQTLSGEVLGTPRYMAPEQAAGRIEEIDCRTDVYGLGAILYSILTGYAPHEKTQLSSKTNTSIPQLLREIVNNPTPLASELNPDVPPELEAVCTKAMARRRYARYATASELADDIEKWMAGEPVSAYREPWLVRCRRWIGEHRRISQIVGVLLTVLIVSAAVIGVTTHETYVAQQHARFESLKGDANSLEDGLRNKAIELTKAARFMAALPPIQGIIDARSGAPSGDGASGDTVENEEVWKGRLQTIYSGLLNAHPDYLSVAFISFADESQEIVRAERQNLDGGLVRIVPDSRLCIYTTSSYLGRVAILKPGDVFLSTSPLAGGPTAGLAEQRLVLTACIPIYDQNSGTVFGVVALESDLDAMLREVVASTAETADSLYFVDGEGKILLHYSKERGFRHATKGAPIAESLPEVAEFFAAGNNADTFSDGSETYAVKVGVDPRRTDAAIGIALTLD